MRKLPFAGNIVYLNQCGGYLSAIIHKNFVRTMFKICEL